MDGLDDTPQQRPGRALLGWMTPEEGVLTLAGRREEDAGKPEYELRARQARLVAAARRPSVDVRGVVTEPPAALRKRWATFEESPKGALLLADGWRMALVDLRRVCAVQAHVFTDTPVPEVDPDDLEAIADITLRPQTETRVDTQYDKERKVWVIHAPNPNFRIDGEFQTEVEPGVLGFGFRVRMFGSFLQVVRHRDRYLIRDGNHRAVTLLGRGINVVPSLVRDSDSLDAVRPRHGWLSFDAYLGDRPPLLPDYLDDDVSAEVMLPSVQRVILIEGLDLALFN